jgi:peptide/nickel transport system substrate-binding protein
MMGRGIRWAVVSGMVLVGLWAGVGTAHAAPQGQLTWAIHFTIAPTYFEPAEHQGIITPMLFCYALHDALVKPMPGNIMAPSLAESWTESPDGLIYEFKLRQGVSFHNGDPFTAADVAFSFQRYKGAAANELKARVREVAVVDPHRIWFHLQAPWPAFMATYATPATGAAWIVPKAYIEKVGGDGFKNHPIGAGPYRFVSQDPGVGLMLEANERYCVMALSCASEAVALIRLSWPIYRVITPRGLASFSATDSALRTRPNPPLSRPGHCARALAKNPL